MAWKDIPSGVIASTVYDEGKLVGRNLTCTLPELTMLTAELKAGGTVEAPITGQVEAMEATITSAAADADMAALNSPKAHTVEVRWVQDVMSNDGTMRQVGFKAFLRANAKTIPGASVEVGSVPENEATLGVTRYQLFADGEEVLLIDQLNGIFKVNGTDYAAQIEALL